MGFNNNKNNNNNNYCPKGDKEPKPANTMMDKYYLCHGWNSMHATNECKVLIAEAKKLKHQHAAGSKESCAKVCMMHHNMLEKDLNALIDERIAAKSKQKREAHHFCKLQGRLQASQRQKG